MYYLVVVFPPEEWLLVKYKGTALHVGSFKTEVEANHFRGKIHPSLRPTLVRVTDRAVNETSTEDKQAADVYRAKAAAFNGEPSPDWKEGVAER
jgi:hypothetical protein